MPLSILTHDLKAKVMYLNQFLNRIETYIILDFKKLNYTIQCAVYPHGKGPVNSKRVLKWASIREMGLNMNTTFSKLRKVPNLNLIHTRQLYFSFSMFKK